MSGKSNEKNINGRNTPPTAGTISGAFARLLK